MPYNILLFPVVAGYIFATRYYISKSKIVRNDGYRLLFEVLKYAIMLFSMSCIIVLYVQYKFSSASTYYHSIIPQEYAHTGKALLSVILAYIIPFLLNLKALPYNYMNSKMIESITSEIEKLMYFSMRDERLIMLCMANRKVYVGYVVSYQVLDDKHVSIVPILSGYRNISDLCVHFNVDYLKACEQLNATNGKPNDFRLDDLVITVPMNHIERASFFDKDVFGSFTAHKLLLA